MEEILFVITHSIMTGCCIWVIVVAMNFRKKDSVIIIEKIEKPLWEEVEKIIEEKKPAKPLPEINDTTHIQLMID